MNVRLPSVCRLWPQIDPWNVWDLTLEQWLIFRATLEQITSDSQKG